MNRISPISIAVEYWRDTKVVATTCNGVDAEQSFLLLVAILVVTNTAATKELEFSRYIP